MRVGRWVGFSYVRGQVNRKNTKNKPQNKEKYNDQQQIKKTDYNEPHLTLNKRTQPIQWTEWSTDALVAAGSLWPVHLLDKKEKRKKNKGCYLYKGCFPGKWLKLAIILGIKNWNCHIYKLLHVSSSRCIAC